MECKHFSGRIDMSSNKKAVKILYTIGIIVAFIIFAIIAYNNMDSEVYSEEYQEELVSNQEITTDIADSADIDQDTEELDTIVEEPGDNEQDANIDEEEVKYYFRNDKLLTQHYEKHGIDMGFDSKESYEAAASMVVTNPDSLHKTEADDGDDVYYLEETNEFVIVSTDGYIRTYFLPDGGKKYFDKQ